MTRLTRLPTIDQTFEYKCAAFKFIFDSVSFKLATTPPTMSASASKGIAIVTGSAQGIGAGIALRLASDGFDVALNDIPVSDSEIALEELSRRIEDEYKVRSIVVLGDVSKEEDVKWLVKKTVDVLGPLDVVGAFQHCNDVLLK